MYDKIYRKDILLRAWKQVKSNGGTGGIDKIFIREVVAYGENKFLGEIQDELINNHYNPKPVKRVYIPREDGKIKDRVVQMATKIVIEPIFEANFKENFFGFKPKRNAYQALDLIRRKCNNKGWWVLDANIKSYFDNIKHNKLMVLIE